METTDNDIDWDEWSKNLETEGFVDKIKNNFNELMKEEYEREESMKEVLESESADYRNLNNELNFHKMLWTVYMHENIRF